MSGGTLLALAADEIVMCEHAVLGPVDPQLANTSGFDLKAAHQKQSPRWTTDIDSGRPGGKGDRANAPRGDGMLADKYPARGGKIAKLMTQRTWTHDFPSPARRARDLELRVNSDMPEI